MRNADLEHEIFAHPDDVAPYAVYGDWLLERAIRAAS
jgi:uncharacterized protein (TIGR02996 family)